MNFTRLPYRPQTRELMDKFLGYDLRPDAPEGSFAQQRSTIRLPFSVTSSLPSGVGASIAGRIPSRRMR